MRRLATLLALLSLPLAAAADEGMWTFDRFPADRELRVEQRLSIEFGGSGSRVMLVTAVDESSVTLDGNHPLAGLDLTFALRLDAIG